LGTFLGVWGRELGREHRGKKWREEYDDKFLPNLLENTKDRIKSKLR